MPFTAKLTRLVEELNLLDDPQERLMLLVDRSRRAPPLSPSERVEANRVHGCVSVVWIVGEVREGACWFRGDAESPVVRGLVILLCEFFSGYPPAAIASAQLDPLDALGLTRDLSPTRRNGLAAATRTIREFACAHAGDPPAR